MASKPGVFKTVDKMPRIAAGIDALVAKQLLVGFPSLTAEDRQDDQPINNPTLGYLHENGAPEQNLPARPFLRPGIEAYRARLAKRMLRAAKAAIAGDIAVIEKQYIAAGLEAVSSIVAVIDAGIPPPLSETTVLMRLHRSPSRIAEQDHIAALGAVAAGVPGAQMPGLTFIKPLIDTGAMKQAITYVIRRREVE